MRGSAAAVVTALLAIACGGKATPRGPVAQTPGFRLDDTVVPTSYELYLDFRDTEQFRGRVAIDVDVRAPIDIIWLHGVELTIERVQLRVGAAELPAWIRPEPRHELIGVANGGVIPAGHARLVLEFTAPYREVLGVFRRGTEVFTTFEPTLARWSFPCFDEPRFKVPWTISVQVPAGQRAYSNAALLSEEGGLHRFAPTEPLPSYLVAVAAGNLKEHIVIDRSPPVRLLAPAGAEIQASALATMREGIRAVEDFFGERQPYPKLDFVAIPEFAFGGMENPGLVSLSAMTVQSDHPYFGVARLRSLTRHEVAHLWIGDQVTPAWWDDVWVFEGLAYWIAEFTNETPDSFAESSARYVDHDPQYAKPARVRIVDHDGLSKQWRVRPDGEARAWRPYRRFGKVSEVFRMVSEWIGEEAFAAAVRRFVHTHRGAHATGADFERSLGEATDEPVSDVLRSFFRRGGIPIIAFDLDCETSPPRIHIRQQFSLRASKQVRADGPWRVPVCIADETGRRCVLLDDTEGEIALGDGACPRWVAPNPGGAGYYDTLLDDDLRAGLAAADLSRDAIDMLARNLYLLVEGCAVRAGELLPTVRALRGSDSFEYRRLLSLLEATAVTAETWDAFRDTYLRPSEASQRRKRDRARFEGFLARATTAQHFETIEHVLPFTAPHDPRAFTILRDRYLELTQKDPPDAVHRAAARALGAATQLSDLDEALTLALDPELRSHGAPAILLGALVKPLVAERALEAYTGHRADLADTLPASEVLATLPDAMRDAPSLCSEHAASLVDQLLADAPEAPVDPTALKALRAAIQDCVELRAIHEPSVTEQLSR